MRVPFVSIGFAGASFSAVGMLFWACDDKRDPAGPLQDDSAAISASLPHFGRLCTHLYVSCSMALNNW